MGPCIVNISNEMQRHRVYLYLEPALHVSGGQKTVILIVTDLGASNSTKIKSFSHLRRYHRRIEATYFISRTLGPSLLGCYIVP
jgi:hypothetical protein